MNADKQEDTWYISSTKYSIQQRQTKKNGKLYDIVFRVADKQTYEEKQKKLSGYKTKQEAKEAYTAYITQHCELLKNRADLCRKTKQQAERENPLVQDAVQTYLASLRNDNKESSLYDKQKLFPKFVLPILGEYKLTELTTQVLARWQETIWNTEKQNGRKQGTGQFLSYAYLQKIRTYLNSFLQYCTIRYGIENNLQNVPKPKRRQPKPVMQFWTQQQFEAFVATVGNAQYKALYTMLFYTGRREGEILALQQQHIDTKQHGITFAHSITRKTTDGTAYKITTTKADKTTFVPICNKVYDIVTNTDENEYIPQQPFFFGGQAPLSSSTILKHFRSDIKKYNANNPQTQIPQIRIHDLRHSFVSLLIHNGANLAVIADLISDTLEQVTKTYGHLYNADKYDIINRLN